MNPEEYDDYTVFSRLAEGRLSTEEWEQVEERLLADAEFRRRYVRFMDMDFELEQRLGQEIPIPDLVPAREPALQSPAPGEFSGKPTPTAKPSSAFIPALLKLAAVLALGLGAWWIGTTYDFGSRDTEITAVPAKEDASRPETSPPAEEPVPQRSPDLDVKEEKSGTALVRVASPQSPGSIPERDPAPATTETAAPAVEPVPTIVDATLSRIGETPVPEGEGGPVLGRVWSGDGSSDEWEPGVEMTAGEYSVARGTIEIRMIAKRENDEEFELEPGIELEPGLEEEFHAGVRILIAGPARFALHSADHVQLHSGKLSAEAFPLASGFTVSANAVDVVDLGTRFAVTANTKGDVAVHVFDGSVTAGLRDRNGEPSAVRSGETLRLDLASNRLEQIAFRSSLFAPRPAWKGGIEGHGATVRVLDRPPREIDRELFSTGNEAVLFRERSGVVLRRALEVNLAGPGEAVPLAKASATIPKGATISSYLFHPDVATAVRTFIRFDSPILGVIVKGDRLFETDRILGAPKTDYPYPDHSGRGLDERHESARIHEDGRTLSIRSGTGKIFSDQVRILVAEDPNRKP